MAVHWVELGGVLLSATGEGGAGFSRLVGWYGLPAGRGGGDAVVGSHGSFDRDVIWREPAAISVEGSLWSQDRAVLDEMRHRVLQAWAGPVLMRVADETGVWERRVEVDSVSLPDLRGGAWALPFVVDVLAPDPVRYREKATLGPAGLPVRSGGLLLPEIFPWDLGTSELSKLRVVNDGSLPLFPALTVTGEAASLVLHGGPRRVEFGALDGTLVVDNRQRRAWLNGADVTRALVRRDWHVVPAGAVQEFFFAAVGASPETSLVVEYRIGAW